jgi:hypothetical protein
MTTLSRNEEISATDRKRLWVVRNYGVLARIARECGGVSAVFVGDVLYGRRKSTGGVVERALAEAGAPGFEEQN